MEAQNPIPPQPARFKKSAWYFLLILAIQFLGFLLNAPDYIPGWQVPVIVLTGVLYFIGVILWGFWIWRTYLNQQVKEQKKELSLAKVAGGAVGILFWMLLTLGLTALFFDREFYGNKFVKEYPYPESGKVIYVYDDGWFAPAATFKVKETAMPWMDFKAKIDGMDPYRIHWTELGDTIIAADGLRMFTYDLKSGAFSASQ